MILDVLDIEVCAVVVDAATVNARSNKILAGGQRHSPSFQHPVRKERKIIPFIDSEVSAVRYSMQCCRFVVLGGLYTTLEALQTHMVRLLG